MHDRRPSGAAPDFLSGGGEMGALMRAHDWSASPLGRPTFWPQALRTVAGLLLGSKFPMFVAWGPELGFLYNDAYAEILGAKHPQALGGRFHDIWLEIWSDISPLIDAALAGEAIYRENLPLLVKRKDFDERTWFTFSYSPVRDESGQVAGMFCAVAETTGQVLAERRQSFRIRLEEALGNLTDPRAIMAAAVTALGQHLGANRAGYSEVQADGETIVCETCFANGVEPLIGTFALSDFGPDSITRQRSGQIEVCDNIAADPRQVHATWAAIETNAFVSVPLVRDGRIRASLYVNFRDAHHWSPEEVTLIEDAAARTWAAVERARAEEHLRQSEAQFRLMADAVPQIVWITDADGRTQFFNRQWSSYTGVPYEPVTAAEIAANYVHPDDAMATMAAFNEARRTGGTFSVEHRIRSAAGQYRWFLVRGEPYRDPSTGEIVRWFGASVDIHDRKLMEDALRESEERLRFFDRLAEGTQTLTDAAEIMALTARLLGQHLKVSVCAYADMDEDEDGFTIRGDWSAPGSRSIVGHYRLADFGKLAVANLSAGMPLVVNDNLVELAPEEAATFQNLGIAATICMPLVKGGRLTALMAIHDRVPRLWTEAELSLLREVTARSWAHVERVAAVAELRASEERHRTLFEAVDAGFCVVEMKFDAQDRAIDYRLAEINPAFERQTGLYGAAGRWVSEVAPGLERHWFDIYGRVALTGEAVRFENHAEPFGRWYDVHAFRTGAPDQHRVAILFNDITERKNAGDRLHQLNATLEERVAARTAERNHVWTLTEDMLARADYQGKLSAVNPAWTKVLGWSEQKLLTNPYTDIIHPEDVGVTVAALLAMGETKQPTRFENRILTSSGEWKPIGWTVSPEPDGQNFIAVGRNLADYRAREQQLLEAQEALRQSQKLEAVGQLTGGVAHDFNNLLTIIKSSTDLLRRPDLAEERRRRYVDAISDTVDRASKLTGQLLAFARRQALKPEVFDVQERIRAISDMLRTVLGSRIQIVTQVAYEHCFVEADVSQFETALVNLAVNARDAMDGEGTLLVQVENLSEMPPLRGHAGGRGPFVAVSVTDTGAGIAPDKLPQIFEPFFTTKEVGKGTGLGLSQVYGFAKQSGGDVAVESEIGRGATFTLYLPRVEGETAEHITANEPTQSDTGGGWRVLVVEDNVEVGTFSTQILQDLGYETTWAANADEALALLAGGLSTDVVFSDVIMPGRSGVELGQEIRRLYPGLPVILTSGYSHVLAQESRHGFELLQKPYAVEELSRVLRRVSRRRTPDSLW